MTFLLLKTFSVFLLVLLSGGLAVNVSPRSSVLDGLRIILLWMLRALWGIQHSPDFWEALKALFGSLMLSGTVAYAFITATDPAALPIPLFRTYTGIGVVVGFLGVAYSSRYQRALLTRKTRS